ncbi:hypothetical protein Egran_05777 [Elaphomyces granulatus]|jgi:NADP-dependent 3-hydroxy acid dehydrogenase YdfG
MFFQ